MCTLWKIQVRKVNTDHHELLCNFDCLIVITSHDLSYKNILYIVQICAIALYHPKVDT